MIFVFFSVFFRCRFSSVLRKAKKSSNMSQQDTESENFGPGSDDPLAPGERQREGYKIFALHKELGFSDSPSVIGQDVSESDFETSLARRWHTFGGRRIETPRGGTPPANHLWRICDRGLVSAGVPGVLGVLGALGVFGYEATTSRKRIPVARQGLGHFSASNVKLVGGQVCAT